MHSRYNRLRCAPVAHPRDHLSFSRRFVLDFDHANPFAGAKRHGKKFGRGTVSVQPALMN